MQFIPSNDNLAAEGTVVLDNTADVLAQADALHQARRIVLQFPKWVDGRAYSQARLLRSRMRYAGELCASGEVLVDMLPLLSRTGFSQVQLAAGQSIAHTRDTLAAFGQGHYQGDTSQSKPLFARDARDNREVA